MQELFVGQKAQKLKMFEAIYKNRPHGNFEYIGLNIAEDGTLLVCCFIPNIRKIEIDHFMNKKTKFYSYDIDDTISALLLRGGVSCDQILEPIYPDNRIDLIPQNRDMLMVMVDTATDEVKAFRMCELPVKVCEAVVENYTKLKQAEVSQAELYEVLKTEIFSRTPERLEQLGRYIGKENNSITSVIMMFPD